MYEEMSSVYVQAREMGVLREEIRLRSLLDNAVVFNGTQSL